MLKKILVLFMAAQLILCSGISFAFAEDVETQIKTTVVNCSDSSVSEESGLPLSSAFAKSGAYTLKWQGQDLKRAIKLETSSDWSDGKYLEFWFYSPVKTTSSFGVAMISDNSETSCIDYYETIVDASFKGWKLVSIPLEELSQVHKPKGFDSIDRVELWPSYGEYSLADEATFYFDNWYVTNVQSENIGLSDDEFVIADFTTMAELSTDVISSDRGSANYGLKKSPDTGAKALYWSDAPRRPDGGTYALYFNKVPTDWTVYNTLEIDLYSEKASGAKMRVATYSVCRPGWEETYGNRSYYYEDIAVEWANERTTLQLRIGPNGNQTTAGTPIGWDQIYSLQFQMSRNQENPDPVGGTKLYISSVKLKNVDYSDLWKEEQFISSGEQTDNWFDFAAKINERYPNNEHPRLLGTQEDIDRIKNTYKDDAWLKGSVELLLDNADSYAELKDSSDSPTGAADRAVTLSLAYVLTGEQKYKDAVWEKWKCMSVDAYSWSPGGQSMLHLGQTAQDAALSYDLMYNYWTEEERMIARNAIVLFGLKPVRSNVLSTNGAGTQDTNWNPVINSGIALSAMAIADAEGYGDISNLFLNRLYRIFKNCFKYYGPDGGGYEGADYWSYALSQFLPYECALYNSVGEENYKQFSNLYDYGMDKTGDFGIHVVGNTGTSFNFYDGAARGVTPTGDFWLARLFDEPKYAGYRMEYSNGNPKNILMYRPDERYATWREDIPLEHQNYGLLQFGSMRSSFEKGSQGFYVGYKGNGANHATHRRLDAGAFVLEALGTRFFIMLPSNDYSFAGNSTDKRWGYYRNRAEGSNTLVIDPLTAQGTTSGVDEEHPLGYDGYNMSHVTHTDQKDMANSPIIKEASSTAAAYAVVDLTNSYSESANSVKRGYALVNSRNAFLLQDEITVKKACEVYSFMHTDGEIEVAEDGKSAIVTKNGKQIKVKLLGPASATLSAMDCELLPADSDDIPEDRKKLMLEGSDNSAYTKLAVKANVSSSTTISLLVTPYYSESSYEYTMENILPIDQWDKLLAEPVALNAIYVNDTPLSTFRLGQTSYTLKEDRVYEVSASADPGISLEIEQAEKVGDTALIRATDSQDNTTVYAVTFSDETQRILDEWDTYAPADILCSTNKANAMNVTDGDVITSWSNPTSEWIAIDLGKVREVSEVQLFWKKNNERVETFDISVSDDAENWTVVWEGDSVLSNDMVAYKFDTVKARYVKVHGYTNTENAYTTIMEFHVTSMGAGFTDVNDSWARLAIEDMAKVGVLEGTSETTFAPDDTLSRAAFLTMLERVFDVEKGVYSGAISDVGENDWFTPYVEAAYSLNLIPEAMLDGGSFKPNQDITREEISALTMSFWERYVGKVEGVSLDNFTDSGDISAWAAPYVAKSLYERIMTGMTDDTFAPHENATRAQAATILKRIYIKIS